MRTYLHQEWIYVVEIHMSITNSVHKIPSLQGENTITCLLQCYLTLCKGVVGGKGVLLSAQSRQKESMHLDSMKE